MTDTHTRLLLRVSVKLLFLFGLAAVFYALFSSLDSNTSEPAKAPAPLLYKLEPLAENRSLRLAWGGGNLILVQRNEEMLASLEHGTENLLDPLSQQSRQPENLPPVTRSLHPELFIAFDRGTDLGCPLRWVPPNAPDAPLQSWPGGFRDSCRGSWYDAAGRVYKGQQAGRNLDIPPYRFLGKDLLEIGRYRDNPPPAN